MVEMNQPATMVEREDLNGNIREVYLFPLQLINKNDFITKEMLDQENTETEKEVESFTEKEVAKFAEEQISPISARKVVTSVVQRNHYVAKYAKLRADGRCELCGQEAPFKVHGEPYLEIDHIKPMRDGGTDTIDNVAAVCPNCNRRIGMLHSKEDVELLKRNIKTNNDKLQKALHENNE